MIGLPGKLGVVAPESCTSMSIESRTCESTRSWRHLTESWETFSGFKYLYYFFKERVYLSINVSTYLFLSKKGLSIDKCINVSWSRLDKTTKQQSNKGTLDLAYCIANFEIKTSYTTFVDFILLKLCQLVPGVIVALAFIVVGLHGSHCQVSPVRSL
jgi:hypothetical protein